MLSIFEGKTGKRSIFNDFAYMDERESQYIRKMYEVSSYYNQNQAYNVNFDLNQYSMVSHPINLMNGMNSVNPVNPMVVPSPQVRPATSDVQPRNNLGFQMNPISKNRKK
jgi:hypothetical protein